MANVEKILKSSLNPLFHSSNYFSYSSRPGEKAMSIIKLLSNYYQGSDFMGNKGKKTTNTCTHSRTAGKYELNPAKWRRCQILSVTSHSLWSTEGLISTSSSNKVALIFREFGFYNWTNMIMNDLHEGLSQACFISSVRLLKLCQSFLPHSKSLKTLSQAPETVSTVFCYWVKSFPIKKKNPRVSGWLYLLHLPRVLLPPC